MIKSTKYLCLGTKRNSWIYIKCKNVIFFLFLLLFFFFTFLYLVLFSFEMQNFLVRRNIQHWKLGQKLHKCYNLFFNMLMASLAMQLALCAWL